MNSSLVRGKGERRLLALASKERLVKILEKMLDEDEFLSEYGIRSSVPRRFHPLFLFMQSEKSFVVPQRSPILYKCEGTELRCGILAR
jgi:hypothetical protein